VLLNQIFKFSIDAVVHFAASANVPESNVNPALYFDNNVAGSLSLLEFMRIYGCSKIIFSSSAAVYGNPIQTPILESHPTQPINAYGESKLMFEKMLYWYHRAYGFDVTIFRYFNAAGAMPERGEMRTRESHLIPLIIDAALGKIENLTVYGNNYDTPDGTCIRDYVHVNNIAEAHVLALDEQAFGIYNLGSGKGYSVLEIIDAVEKIMDIKINYSFADRRPGDPARLVADAKKAHIDLGWRPKHNLEDILASAIAWRIKTKDMK
jgi:UDP-glucose 4-epimerase